MAFDPFGGAYDLPDPEQLKQQYLTQLAPQPQPGLAPPSMSGPPPAPQTTTYTNPGQQMGSAPLAPSPAPAPSPTPVPAPAPAPAPAPTWRNMEDTWINFLGTQGLQATRPGFYGQGGVSVQDMVNRYNQGTNQHATYVGGPSGDLVDFHDGRGPVDVRTAQGEFWYSEPGQAGGGGGGYAPTTGGIDPRMGAGAGFGSAGFGGESLGGPFREALLALMKRSGQPIDTNSAEFQQRYLPIRNELERNAMLAREQAAERAGATGGYFGAGNLGQLGSINERLGMQEAQALGQQINQDIQQKRQDLMSSLQLANAVGAREVAAQIQMKLAELENTYRYSALNQNQSQWNDRYGLERLGMENQMNREALLYGLNG